MNGAKKGDQYEHGRFTQDCVRSQKCVLILVSMELEKTIGSSRKKGLHAYEICTSGMNVREIGSDQVAFHPVGSSTQLIDLK